EVIPERITGGARLFVCPWVPPRRWLPVTAVQAHHRSRADGENRMRRAGRRGGLRKVGKRRGAFCTARAAQGRAPPSGTLCHAGQVRIHQPARGTLPPAARRRESP